MGPLILLRRPLAETSEDLSCTSSATSGRTRTAARMWLSLRPQGYADNPHEVEARRAVAETR